MPQIFFIIVLLTETTILHLKCCVNVVFLICGDVCATCVTRWKGVEMSHSPGAVHGCYFHVVETALCTLSPWRGQTFPLTEIFFFFVFPEKWILLAQMLYWHSRVPKIVRFSRLLRAVWMLEGETLRKHQQPGLPGGGDHCTKNDPLTGAKSKRICHESLSQV